MAATDLAPVGAEDDSSAGVDPVAAPGRSSARRVLGLAGQYGVLVLLSLLVLGPVLLTIIQALSPPFRYAEAGLPLHPVEVDWKDRTWFTGGAASIVVRTLGVALLLAWVQKVASIPASWRSLREPARVVSIVLGVAAIAVVSAPVFQSFRDADGRSSALAVALMAAVAASQVPGFLAGGRRVLVAVLLAVATGVVIGGAVILFVGPEVWTATWSSYALGPAMTRSFTMAILITALQVVTSILAAYAFTFLRFPFKRLLFALFMGTLLLPLEVTLVGNVATIRQLEWINTMHALVLPFGASALGTFLLRQGFKGLPPDLRDATRLDGYGHVAFLAKFAVPLTRPVVASFTVISALAAWNQYLWPRAVIDQDRFNTLQIQLQTVSGKEVSQANLVIASALVAAVPVILLLIAFQRQIIRGLTAGAVK